MALIALGIFFRFDGLGKPLMWHDEALTLLHVSGYLQNDVANERILNSIIDFGQLRKDYQMVSLDRGPKGVLEALEVAQPEHAPLFYLITYFWGRQFGARPETIRIVPALFGTLELPAACWFALELFQAPLAAALAVVLVALSPLQLFFSQELREYSLFSLMIFLTSAALLRAHRTKQLKDWLLYSVLLSAGFYSSYLMPVVAVAHFAYITIKEKPKISNKRLQVPKIYWHYLLSAIPAPLLLYPWLAAVLPRFKYITELVSWVKQPVSFGEVLNAWVYGPSNVFLMRSTNSELTNSLLSLLLLIQLISVIVAYRHSKAKVFAFLGCLYVVSVCFFHLPDLIMGGQRSLYIKYTMAIPIAVLMFVAYACYVYMSSNIPLLRFIWTCLAVFIVGCEIDSCRLLLTTMERTKIRNQSLEIVAKILNSDRGSLLVCAETPLPKHTNLTQMLALSHIVKPDTKLLWLDAASIPVIPEGIDHFYLFDPPYKLLGAFKEGGYKISDVNNLGYLFIVRPPAGSQ